MFKYNIIQQCTVWSVVAQMAYLNMLIVLCYSSPHLLDTWSSVHKKRMSPQIYAWHRIDLWPHPHTKTDIGLEFWGVKTFTLKLCATQNFGYGHPGRTKLHALLLPKWLGKNNGPLTTGRSRCTSSRCGFCRRRRPAGSNRPPLPFRPISRNPSWQCENNAIVTSMAFPLPVYTFFIG